MSKNNVIAREFGGLPEVPSWEQLSAYAHKVALVRKKWPLIVGEIAAKALDNYGEKAWQILDEFGYTHQAVINFKHVYKRVHDQYTEALPFTFWQDAARIEKTDQRDQFITHALSNNWKRADWRAALPQYGAEPTPVHQNGSNGTATVTAAISKGRPINVTKLLRLVTVAAQAVPPFAASLVTAGQELEETTISAVTLQELRDEWDELQAAVLAMFTAFEVGTPKTSERAERTQNHQGEEAHANP